MIEMVQFGTTWIESIRTTPLTFRLEPNLAITNLRIFNRGNDAMNRIYAFMLILGGICLGCNYAHAQDTTPFVSEGYHLQLKPLKRNEGAQAINFLMAQEFSFPETSPVTWLDIIQAANSNLQQTKSPMRLVFEFSKGSEEYFRPKLTNVVTSWNAKTLNDSQVREKLKTSSLYDVLSALSSDIGINVVWFKDTVVLSNYLAGD